VILFNKILFIKKYVKNNNPLLESPFVKGQQNEVEALVVSKTITTTTSNSNFQGKYR